jgi:predicted nucleic acid-binding Zn ribbon protein
MRLKKCVKCGKLFNTAKNEQALCDDCVAAGKATTIRPRTCRECGTTFDGGPRAWYCPSCRKNRQKEVAARYRKNGPNRSLGSIDHCIVCGKEYVVKSGRQRYCPDCAEDAVRQLDREASKKWNAENNFYERRSQQPRCGQKICVICGNPVPPGTPRITCSPKCNKLRIKRNRGNIR